LIYENTKTYLFEQTLKDVDHAKHFFITQESKSYRDQRKRPSKLRGGIIRASDSPKTIDETGFMSLMGVIREMTHHLYMRHRCLGDRHYELGKLMIKHGVRVYPGHDATVDEIRTGMIQELQANINLLYADVVRLPGFDQLEANGGVKKILARGILLIYTSLVHHRLLMNNEWFRQFPNGVQFSSKCIDLVLGGHEALFAFISSIQDLNFTAYELALLLPCVLTKRYGKEERKILFFL
jgi:hypothetical protein